MDHEETSIPEPSANQPPLAPADEGQIPISPEPLPLKGPPWLIGLLLYDGTCEEVDELILRNAPAIDEATSHSVQFTRVGNAAEVCPVYERLRGTWLRAKDKMDVRVYRDEIESGVGQDHIRRREMHALCRQFGVAGDQLPCIAFFANPPSSPPAFLKIRPEWIANRRAQREFINALIDFFRSVGLDRLAAECRTNVALVREFGRQIDDYMGSRLRDGLVERNPMDLNVVDGERRGKPVKTQQSFPTSVGTRWSEVSIWLTDHDIIVETRGLRRNFSFVAAGFEEKRRRGVPDGIWRLLKVLARFGGVIPFSGADLDRGTRTNLKQYMSVLRKRMQSLIPGIGGNPIPHNKGERCYRCAFKIAAQDSPTCPVPDGATWSDITIALVGCDAIRVSVPSIERFAACDYSQEAGEDTHRWELAERESELERDYQLRGLGLADEDGLPNAAGKALIELLRANGALIRPAEDDAMLDLCGVLSELMAGISGSPFRFAPSSEKWIALFQTSCELP